MKKLITCCIFLVLANAINAQSYFKENLFTTYLTNTIYSLSPTVNNTIVIGADARVAQGNAPESYIGELSSSGSLLWNKTFQFKDDAGAFGAIKTNDNGYAMLSSTGFFVKLKSDHSVQFIKKIKFQYATGVEARGFVQTSDNGYMIAGSNGQHPSDDNKNIFLYKIDSAGNYQWSKNILGYSNGNSINKTKTGGYLVSGTSTLKDGHGDMCVIKTDSVGNVIFSAVVGGPNYDVAHDAEETSDSGCLVVGETYGVSNIIDGAYIAKFNASGTLEWTKTLRTNGDNGNMRGWRILKDRHNTNTIVSVIVDSVSTGYEHLINISNDGTVNKKVTTLLDSGVSFTYVAACRGDDKSVCFGTSAYGSGRTGFVITKSQRNGTNCTAATVPVIITENEGTATPINQGAATYPGSVRDALSLVYGDGGTTIVSECAAANDASQIVNVTANQTLQLSNKLSVSPNPASAVIRINGLNASATSQLSITDVAGKILASVKTRNSYYNWNIQSLSKGLYFIRIQTNEKITTLKFIKE